METFILVILFLVAYFLPMFIAISRMSASKNWVIFLNIFLWWTIIGWIICFIWAFWKTKEEVELQKQFYKNSIKN